MARRRHIIPVELSRSVEVAAHYGISGGGRGGRNHFRGALLAVGMAASSQLSACLEPHDTRQPAQLWAWARWGSGQTVVLPGIEQPEASPDAPNHASPIVPDRGVAQATHQPAGGARCAGRMRSSRISWPQVGQIGTRAGAGTAGMSGGDNSSAFRCWRINCARRRVNC